MTVSKKIRQNISDFPDDFVFSVSDLECDFSQKEAAARTLQRMAERGEVSKLSNGKYYKPRKSLFGTLRPSPSQIAKEFLTKDGRITGYLTGPTAFSQYSLTTQISSNIQIGSNVYRRPMRRGSYRLSFVVQPNEISEDTVDILRLLDCIKMIKEIPGTTPNEACKRIIHIIKDLSDKDKTKAIELALKYSPKVRALLGAIMDYVEYDKAQTDCLRNSLTGVSKYILPISDSVLPTKTNWKIYEPTRK